VPGVAEVASVGGYVQQYQIDVDPNKLRGVNIPISAVVEAVRNQTTMSEAMLSSKAGNGRLFAGSAL
jgi:Cu(I)/Ag(I) efflux system membrane protein CusA/SilA